MKPKTDKQGWEEKFNRKFDPDKGTWWRKDLYKSSPKVYILAVEYNKYIKHFIRDLLSLQREQVRREVVDEADLLLAMVQSTTEDTHHSEIIEMIGNIRNALSSDGEKKGTKQKKDWNWIEKKLSQAHQQGYKEAVKEVKQLTINLKVNINSNVDTRTMEYRAYLQRKGHNGALTLLHDSLNSLLSKLEGKDE